MQIHGPTASYLLLAKLHVVNVTIGVSVYLLVVCVSRLLQCLLFLSDNWIPDEMVRTLTVVLYCSYLCIMYEINRCKYLKHWFS